MMTVTGVVAILLTAVTAYPTTTRLAAMMMSKAVTTEVMTSPNRKPIRAAVMMMPVYLAILTKTCR